MMPEKNYEELQVNNDNENNNLNYFLKANLFILFVIFIVLITPIINHNTSNLIIIILLGLWFITAALSDLRYFTIIEPVTVKVILWIIYLFLFRIFKYLDSTIGNMYEIIIFWFFAIVMNFYFNLKNQKTLKIIVQVLTTIIIVNIFSNIIEIGDNLNLSKNVTSMVVDNSFYTTNVGNVSFMFSVALFTMAFIHFAFIKQETNQKLVFIILSLAGLYLVFLSSSLITLLVMVLMIMIYFFLQWYKKRKLTTKIRVILIGFVCLVSMFFFRGIISDILILVAKKSSNILLANRIEEIALMLVNKGEVFSSPLTRPSLYLKSLKTFIENPIFGKGMIHNHFYNLTYIGMHSQILDDLGRYGLVGLIFVVSIFKSYHKINKNYYDNPIYILYLTCLFGVIVFSLLNTTINSNSGVIIAMFIFLFLPYILNIESQNSSDVNLEEAQITE